MPKRTIQVGGVCLQLSRYLYINRYTVLRRRHSLSLETGFRLVFGVEGSESNVRVTGFDAIEGVNRGAVQVEFANGVFQRCLGEALFCYAVCVHNFFKPYH